jgi:hypothetical protein
MSGRDQRLLHGWLKAGVSGNAGLVSRLNIGFLPWLPRRRCAVGSGEQVLHPRAGTGQADPGRVGVQAERLPGLGRAEPFMSDQPEQLLTSRAQLRQRRHQPRSEPRRVDRRLDRLGLRRRERWQALQAADELLAPGQRATLAGQYPAAYSG